MSMARQGQSKGGSPSAPAVLLTSRSSSQCGQNQGNSSEPARLGPRLRITQATAAALRASAHAGRRTILPGSAGVPLGRAARGPAGQGLGGARLGVLRLRNTAWLQTDAAISGRTNLRIPRPVVIRSRAGVLGCRNLPLPGRRRRHLRVVSCDRGGDGARQPRRPSAELSHPGVRPADAGDKAS